MIEREYIEKGGYNHPQPDGYVSLKQYIFVRKDGKRCLLFRFANEFSQTVTGFEIVVTQLSGDGRTLGHSRICYDDLSIRSGDIFAPSSGVVVHENCADFRIRLVYFVSGVYKYSVKRGKAVAHYDPRGYVAPKTRPAKSTQISVSSVFSATDGVFTAVSVFAILIIIALGLITKTGLIQTDSGNNNDNKLEQDYDDDSNISFGDDNSDYGDLDYGWNGN